MRVTTDLKEYKMTEEVERGSTRREHNNDDRRGSHRRIEHRRKENANVGTERRNVVDQREGYQRKSNRRSSSDRRS